MTRFLLLLLIFEASALPCATVGNDHPANQSKWKSYWLAHRKLQPPRSRRPSADLLPTAMQEPWGGPDAARWSPEAVMANAVSEALNDGWAQSDVKDVLVAVPVQMNYSSLRPYADGQTNAAVSYGETWKQSRPPLVATLVLTRSGDSLLKFRFDRSLAIPPTGAKIVFYRDGALREAHLDRPSKTSDGGLELIWHPDPNHGPIWGNLFSNQVAYVQPDGWQDWFPIDFRNVVEKAESLLAAVPPASRALGKGTLLDPEKVSVQGSGSTAFPFLNMGDPNFGGDVNGDRYFPVPGPGIHNEFPTAGGVRRTAIGHGNTLVMIKKPAPFKLAYICFDARNPVEERKFGVPSGGGWHEVGDPAETVFNTLENAPVIFGYANGMPSARPPSGNFAYGLSDIAVIRKLMPGSALITAAGVRTRQEDTSGWENRGQLAPRGLPGGRTYHWFIFDQPHEVCALEWVHPCVPAEGNGFGMLCH